MINTSSSSAPDYDKISKPQRKKVLIENAPPGPSNYSFVRRLIDQDIDVEENWKEVWEDILMRNGQIDIELLKRELFDYGFLMQEASKVYRHVTGGRVKEVAYLAEKVIEDYNEHLKTIKDEEDNKH